MSSKRFVLVFDYDDTLTIDTERQKKDLFVNVFSSIVGARAIARAFVQSHASMPRQQMLEGILHNLASRGLVENPAGLLEAYLLRFSELAENVAVEADLRSGAVETLQTLAKSYPLYLNSANPHEALQRIVIRRGWDKLFTAAYGNPPGSKAQYLRTIMDREGVDPSQTVVIGDGESDRAAAERWGCHFIGIRGEYSTFEEGVFPIIQELPQLIPIISAM